VKELFGISKRYAICISVQHQKTLSGSFLFTENSTFLEGKSNVKLIDVYRNFRESGLNTFNALFRNKLTRVCIVN
jgi:hypothetical protein